MSGAILGPRGETINLTKTNRGLTPEQLKFIAHNAPKLGELPADATQQSRSQRQIIALQQGLFRLSQDNYQLWMLLAACVDEISRRNEAGSTYGRDLTGPVVFGRERLAPFADPKTWPSVEQRPDGDGLEIITAAERNRRIEQNKETEDAG